MQPVQPHFVQYLPNTTYFYFCVEGVFVCDVSFSYFISIK